MHIFCHNIIYNHHSGCCSHLFISVCSFKIFYTRLLECEHKSTPNPIQVLDWTKFHGYFPRLKQQQQRCKEFRIEHLKFGLKVSMKRLLWINLSKNSIFRSNSEIALFHCLLFFVCFFFHVFFQFVNFSFYLEWYIANSKLTSIQNWVLWVGKPVPVCLQRF